MLGLKRAQEDFFRNRKVPTDSGRYRRQVRRGDWVQGLSYRWKRIIPISRHGKRVRCCRCRFNGIEATDRREGGDREGGKGVTSANPGLIFWWFGRPTASVPTTRTMALITIVGFPCSGKSTRASQIKEYLEKRIRNESDGPKLGIVLVDDDNSHVPRSTYDSQSTT